jgi:hypothetical protein
VLQLKGVYGGNWSAVAYRAVDLSSSHTITFRVRNSDWGGTGRHRFNVAVDLMSGPDWAAGGRWLLFFGVDGKIRTPLHPSTVTNLDLAGGESVTLGDYDNLDWYDVQIWYKRTVNSTVVLSFTVNGTYVGAAETPYVPEEWDLAYIGLWSGDTTVWFDDVGVLPH